MDSKRKEEDHRQGKKTCASCGSGKLSVAAIIDQEGIPPGEEGHTITYFQVILTHCPECGCGIVERLDHDCFDWEEVFDQYEWYLLDKPDFDTLLDGLKSCPDPMSPDCICAVHLGLRSSVNTLPVNSWGWALEGEHHEHKVKVRWSKVVPWLELNDDQEEG